MGNLIGGFGAATANYPTAGNWQQLEVVITPEVDGSSDGYFFAQQVGFSGATDPAYIGLQTIGASVFGAIAGSKVAVFSVWGSTAGSSSGYSGAFSSEGSGWQTAIAYPWVANRSYKASITIQGTQVTGQITDLTTNITSVVGLITVESGRGLLNSQVIFHERYSGIAGDPNAVQPSAVSFTNAVADSNNFATSWTPYNYTDEPLLDGKFSTVAITNGVRSVINLAQFASFSYHDSQLTNGVTYYYTVTGVNAQGESAETQVPVTPSSTPTGAVTAAFKSRVQLKAASVTKVTSGSALAQLRTRTTLRGASATQIGPRTASASFKTRPRLLGNGKRVGPISASASFKTRPRLRGASASKVTRSQGSAQLALNPKLRGTGNVVVPTYTPAPPQGVQQYRVVMVTRQGVPVVELLNATVSEMDVELNASGNLTFSVPANDPANTLANISCWGNEVQIWRRGRLLWWGVPTRIQTNAQTTEVQCRGLLEYFAKRFVGKANRDNLLSNPSFETGIYDGWYASGVTGIWDTSHLVMGSHSLRLDQGGVGVDTSWQQNVGSLSANTLYILSGSAHIYGDAKVIHPEYPLGPSFDNRGLYVELRDRTGAVRDIQFAQLTYDVQGQTVRLTTSISTAVLGNDVDGAFLNVRLYAIGGITMWDAIELVTMASLSYQNVDQAYAADGLVAHAQDPNFSKSDLNIGRNCPLTGVNVSVSYQWSDHGNILELLQSYNNTSNGMDMDIEFDARGTQRVFTTFFPKKGVTRTQQVLEFGKNMTEFTFSEDGESTTNSVIELGEGSGPDRYEGFAIDTGALNGLVLEMVETAPSGVNYDGLYGIAAQRLAQTKNIVMMPEISVFDTPDMPLIGILDTGDIVPVRISYGRVQYQGNYRIAKIAYNTQNDSMSLTLNAP